MDERAAEAVAAWAAAQETIDQIDERLRQREERLATAPQMREWTAPPEAPKPVSRAPAPRERPAQQPQQHLVDWPAVSLWTQDIVRQIVDIRIGKKTLEFIEGAFDAFGEEVGKDIAKLMKRVAELETRVVELRGEIAAAEARVRIANLEAALAAAEARALPKLPPPRLISGGSDAAD